MSKTRLDPNCWDGYKKAGKTKIFKAELKSITVLK
jgi:hypothetical protein